ncbi:hypothetical protein KNO15_19750 [Leifsonia shinshuensis]|uniref:hypothetical protein n=1 Tax=Leifsonia shinshuensis TaxID=150026 RepID=UPI001F514F3B|nr:hypothetical protein [Leifsonia shinshuensis]MCI0158943.1 hypothetical protein [Leifsonia shinshuensis]
MSGTTERPWVPAPGTPAVLMLAVIVLITAPPAVLVLLGQPAPAWVLTISFAFLLAAILAVPRLNRRARPASRRQTMLVRTALSLSILVPLALVCPAVAYPGFAWLIGIGVQAQVLALATVAVAAVVRRGSGS